MEKNLLAFNNSDFGEIRTVTIDGEPWFVGKDIALALGYSNTKDALSRHVDEEDKRQDDGVVILDPMGREQHPTIINESGLYSLVLSSKLPTAKEFKHWVTKEILPSIRKTGRYIAPRVPSDYDIKMLEAREKEAEARLVEARNKTYELMISLWDSVNVGKQYQALALNGYNGLPCLPRESFSESCVHMYDATTIAKDLGIMSGSNNPHAKAVSAIIGTFGLDASEYAETPYSKNGHDGISIQYVKGVKDKVKRWLETNSYPNIISINGRNYKVQYKE